MSNYIQPPHNYAEWTDILKMLKNKTDDDLVLNAMYQGTLEWQTGTAERFTKRLTDAVNFRLNSAIDRFQNEMNHSRGEQELVRALIALRREMCFLARSMNLPVIPEKDRAQYVQMVVSQANAIQDSLEESAKKDRSGKLGSVIRNNPVNAF